MSNITKIKNEIDKFIAEKTKFLDETSTIDVLEYVIESCQNEIDTMSGGDEDDGEENYNGSFGIW